MFHAYKQTVCFIQTGEDLLMKKNIRGFRTICVLLSVVLSLAASCDDDDDSVADDTGSLTLNFIFEGNTTCESFLAEGFIVSVYDETHVHLFSRDVACTDDADSVEITVENGFYYIIVQLQDANNNTKSYGSMSIEVAGATDADVYMEDYKGGITFSWDHSLCAGYDIEILNLTIENEGVVVSANLWGEEIHFDDYKISCSAESLVVNNIDSGLYQVAVGGYRDILADRPRIMYDVPEFVLVTGQDTPVDLDKYFTINVSDLIIFWEFDSKSMESCETAGVELIKVDIKSSSGTIISETAPCVGDSGRVEIFDLEEDIYNVSVSGLDDSDNRTFFGEAEHILEKGNIGRYAEELLIYIKEL